MNAAESSAILVFLCLFLIYSAITVLCGFRAVRLHKFSSEWRHTKFFYLTVLSQALLRAICFLVILTNIGNIDDKGIYLLLSVPDSLFVVSYLMLTWQTLTVFYYAHHSQLRSSFLAKLAKRPTHSFASAMLVTLLILWLFAQSLLYLLMIANIITETNISTEIGLVNFILPVFVIGSMIYLQIKYSGMPARSLIWKSRLKKINCVTIFWSIARFAGGVDNILAEYSEPSISSNITNRTDHAMDTAAAALMILSLIISEVICMILVLDFSFIGIFLFSEEDDQQSLMDRSPSVQQTRSSGSSERDDYTTFSMIITNMMMTMDDLEIKEEMPSRKNGFGKLYKASYKGMPVVLRKIIFKRLSGYVLEEFTAEIDSYQNLVSNKIIPIVGVILDLPTVGIVSPYINGGSLYKALHVEKAGFTKQEKYHIALELASCLETVHAQGKVHGHLSSENILLNDEGVALISDLGFQKMKKYAGIIFGYTNKSGWSSPEILQEKRLTPLKVVPSDDIYSFGMVLWELMTGQEPFPGYSSQQLYQHVVVDNYRPMIPAEIPEALRSLIISCWNKEPANRPSMQLIARTLTRLINEQ
ncbi:unnamed protein product [Blepharisma stoltei]|uniref:Protein kinase domain-containing protein n=1 Tax=Blepharisma stoltei TaxID=1481888 RepID=A0AAU9IAC3_9CILI|nr:unnamed protein product [Blepharisma stoltei]